jgi:N-acyl-D-amino-acid deacylase
LLAEGFYADITAFDADTVIDRATFAEPRQYPVGIVHVMVNGQLVVDGGHPTGTISGRVLRKGSE